MSLLFTMQRLCGYYNQFAYCACKLVGNSITVIFFAYMYRVATN